MERLKCDLGVFLSQSTASHISAADWQTHAWILTQHLMACYEACHALELCHRDVKPQNVLVADDPSSPIGVRLKLCDFAHSKIGDRSQATTTLVLAGEVWDSPEVLKAASSYSSYTYTPATDMWGVGCLMFYIKYRGQRLLFANQAQVLKAVKQASELVTHLDAHGLQEMDPLLFDLLLRLLKPQAARISSAQALLHPYFWTTGDVLSISLISEHLQDPSVPLRGLQKYLQHAEPRVFGDSWQEREGDVFPKNYRAPPNFRSLASLIARFRNVLVHGDRQVVEQSDLESMPHIVRPSIIKLMSLARITNASIPDQDADLELVCNYFVRWFPQLLPALYDAIRQHARIRRGISGIVYDLVGHATQEDMSVRDQTLEAWLVEIDAEPDLRRILRTAPSWEVALTRKLTEQHLDKQKFSDATRRSELISSAKAYDTRLKERSPDDYFFETKDHPRTLELSTSHEEILDNLRHSSLHQRFKLDSTLNTSQLCAGLCFIDLTFFIRPGCPDATDVVQLCESLEQCSDTLLWLTIAYLRFRAEDGRAIARLLGRLKNLICLELTHDELSPNIPVLSFSPPFVFAGNAGLQILNLRGSNLARCNIEGLALKAGHSPASRNTSGFAANSNFRG
eukprot:m.411347 g.411347  ORF g.411347 m.411347 type:complete len:625 (-) comp56553_c0_seq4:119-1993(-)